MDTAKYGEFAQQEMHRMGWTPGTSLGATNSGRLNPVLPSKKDSFVAETTWWDSVMNKALSQLTVVKAVDGAVSFTVDKDVKPATLYGFVKSGAGKTDFSQKISDKDLFEACGGRSCRKGAFVEQPGKLKRVDAQGLEVAAPKDNDILEVPESTSKKLKKAKKSKKHLAENMDTKVGFAPNSTDNALDEQTPKELKKKSKKMKKLKKETTEDSSPQKSEIKLVSNARKHNKLKKEFSKDTSELSNKKRKKADNDSEVVKVKKSKKSLS